MLADIVQKIPLDDKIVVFTEFKEVAIMIGDALPRSIVIDGSLPEKTRTKRLDTFRSDPECRILVCTRVLGMGINLQFANYIINYDMHYNPARMNQRVDRLHRIKQTMPVYVINIIARDSIEAMFERIHKRKHWLACEIIEGKYVEPKFSKSLFLEELAVEFAASDSLSHHSRGMAGI